MSDTNCEACPSTTPIRRGLSGDLWHKLQLWWYAVSFIPFYRYGELGNLLFNIAKSILEGAVLYAMFSMAETEYKVAAIMGVLTKYIYPAIVVLSNARISSFIDHIETLTRPFLQVRSLVRGLVLVAVGEAIGALLLMLCYPPVFEWCFGGLNHAGYLLIVLYLLHHVCSGSAQIFEGRLWFKLLEIKVRHCPRRQLAQNFWGINAMSQNIHLVLSVLLLWGTTAVSSLAGVGLDAPLMLVLVGCAVMLAIPSKFTLPLAWRLKLRKQELDAE
ncbi:MAG: hypothetical protein J7K75_10440 [Desulfuromonas sp.]|nr:hypothetical protein [Desulfuromonas sp.]